MESRAVIGAGEAPPILTVLHRGEVAESAHRGDVAVVGAGGGGAVLALALRSDTELHVLRDRAPLYVMLSDGSVRNGYTLKILNKAREQRSYTLRADRVKTLTAIDVPAAETATILRKLGFAVEGTGPHDAGPWTAAVPSWRPDIEGEADLGEEVTRVFGFDNIPTTSLPRLAATSRPVRTPLQRRVPLARRALAARGMNEAVTWSFLPRKQAERFGGGAEDLRLLNSIDATLDTMRPSILPNLIDAATRNEARGLFKPRADDGDRGNARRFEPSRRPRHRHP